jgi:serine/threonine protein kinase
LKPSDIGLNKNFELKIIDLNVERPNEKDYVITKWYKAPETLYNWKPPSSNLYWIFLIVYIIMFDSLEQNVDMWSVGCILAEFLSGRILFAGRDRKIFQSPTFKQKLSIKNLTSRPSTTKADNRTPRHAKDGIFRAHNPSEIPIYSKSNGG